MARANPEKSFQAAVHHLFRHVHDAGELSRNPLGRLFLYDDRGLRMADEAALSELRAYLKRAADDYRMQAFAEGRTLEGERGRKIVQAILSGREPGDVAGELELSLRQYYRDRRAVCAKIGAALTQSRQKAFPVGTSGDSSDLVLRRAQMLGEAGFARKAQAELERSIAILASARSRTRALIELQRVAILAGDLNAASLALERAQALLPQPDRDVDPFLCNALLLSSIRLARAAGRHHIADKLLQAAEAIDLAHDPSDRFSSELALYVLIEMADFYCVLSRFSKARHALERAQRIAEQIAHVPVACRVDLAILSFEAFVDSSLAEEEWLARMHNAHDLSMSLGSVRGVLLSTIALTKQFANAGAELEARSHARLALDIARRTDCPNMLVRCVTSIANAMLPAKHWRTLDPVLFEAEGHCNRGSEDWIWIKLFHGSLLRRLGDSRQAWDAVGAAEREARQSGNQRIHASVLTALSTLLAAPGHSAAAKEYIREAIAIGEAAAGAEGLLKIYSIAAKISNDQHLGHRANQAREGMRYATEAARRRRPVKVTGV